MAENDCPTCDGWGEILTLTPDGASGVAACPTCSPDAYETDPA